MEKIQDPPRNSHEGLLSAGYVKREPDAAHPAVCTFCNAPLSWYFTPQGKYQPFNPQSS